MGEFPRHTTGGGEPPVHPDLGGAVAVAGAEPAVMGAVPVDVGFEAFLDRPHPRKSRLSVSQLVLLRLGISRLEVANLAVFGSVSGASMWVG
jgi:hypothetical protein